jgi:hypothetical protein
VKEHPYMRRLIWIPVMLAFLLWMRFLLPQDSLPAFGNAPGASGSIMVFVKDGFSEKPLPGAEVIIVEDGKSYSTDSEGKTPIISVPILQDPSYRSILPKPWGEITLLIYKEGYIDCAIFHVNVMEKQTRHGPTVLLFPLDNDGTNQPFVLTEGPNPSWTKQLLDQYRP